MIGQDRKGKERKGNERKGKERKGNFQDESHESCDYFLLISIQFFEHWRILLH